MKLEKCNSLKEYTNVLTRELDKISGISNLHYYDIFHHYILVDDYCKNEKCLAIRIPGGTVGSIYYNDKSVITKIIVDTNYVVKTYPTNVNELIQKFVGEVIEWQ